MTLKERIKELCDINKISFKKLEGELGLGSGYLSKLGKTTPNTSNIQKIANYFHVSVSYLVGDEAYSGANIELATLVRNDLALSAALQKYATMSDSKKKLVIEYINMLSEVSV
jgi:transcriptional regulator with XRE-family HTH domain